MKWFDNISLALVIIGAVNWLLIGIFRFDLVAFLFGNLTWLSRIIYTLVGSAACMRSAFLEEYEMHPTRRSDKDPALRRVHMKTWREGYPGIQHRMPLPLIMRAGASLTLICHLTPPGTESDRSALSYPDREEVCLPLP